MLSNIIDGSDRTDHFDRIIPKRIITICRQYILFAKLPEVYEAMIYSELLKLRIGLDFTVKG